MSEDSRYWSLGHRDEFLELTLDVPGGSTNTLSKAVLLELARHLDTIAARRPAGLILRSKKPSGFAAGADIREFTTLRTPEAVRAQIELGHRVFDALEALPLPTAVVVHGFCLGGGLELALACRYRIGFGDRTLALGLPEVLLGIHPGYGGSARSIRLLGVMQAMPLMLTGRKLKGRQAKEIGLLDQLCDDEAQALQQACELLRRQPSARRAAWHARLLGTTPLRPFIQRRLLAELKRKLRPEHYPAPYALVNLWAKYGARGHQALRAEVDSLVELAATPAAANLVRLFLLQERLKSLGERTAPPPRKLHVIGAGVMGADIAAWCAHRGLEVTLQDRDLPSLERGMQRANDYFAKKIRDPQQRRLTATRLRADPSGEAVAEADVVLEAIIEHLPAKQALLRELEARLPAGVLIASNTSSIRLGDMSQVLADPSRFVGLHFFNPVGMMPLLEIVHDASTAPAIVNRAIAFAQAIDKLPLPCRSSPGFLVNRVLVPYMFEAMQAAAEGLSFDAIDQAALDYGMPVGPIELADQVGLDVCRHVGEIVMRALGRPLPDLSALDALIAQGKLGRKSGAGLRRWDNGQIVRERQSERSGSAAPAYPDDLPDRLLLALANEAVACWREGIVADVDLIDAGIVFGSGYAPFRGGPLQAAHARGREACRTRLAQLADRYGERFTPDPGWSSLPTGATAISA